MISNIKIKNNTFENTYLSDTDFDYLNSNKKEFVKTVLPIIINENQKIIVTREFLNDLKIKLQTFKTINNNEISKLNKIAKKFNIKYSNKHKLDLIEEILANVDIIPAIIFTDPTTAIAIFFCSSGTNESIAKLAVPVRVDRIITGIVNV